MKKYIGLAVLILALTFVGTWGYTGSPPATIWSEFTAIGNVDMGDFKIENLAGPTNSNDAVNLSYFNSNEQYLPDDPASSSVDMNGYSIGSLADPSTDSDAVTLSYFQANDSFEADNFLPDDPASSDVNMNGYQIGSLADPTNDSDALTLGYFNSNDGVTGKDSGSNLGDGTTINWGSNLSATLSAGEFTVDASSGGSGDTTVNVFDSGTFQGEASDLDFSTDLSVSFSGDTATISSTASGGSSSDTDIRAYSFPLTSVNPGDSVSMVRNIPFSDTAYIHSMGIQNSQQNIDNNWVMEIRDLNNNYKISDTTTSKYSFSNASVTNSDLAFIMKNLSSDTESLTAFVEVGI